MVVEGFESLTPDWLGFDEARARCRAGAAPLPEEHVPLSEAGGRALALPLEAPISLPPWDNSAMDGFAFRAADLDVASSKAPPRLRVLGEALAGRPWDGAVEPGTAIRIMTGAPIPVGADTVVRVEDVRSKGDAIEIVIAPRTGANIRSAGEDMAGGDALLHSGETLGPGAVAVLASCGQATVAVHRRPVVALLPSGDELVEPADFATVIAGRGIVDSNSPMLAAAIAEAGGIAKRLGIAQDEVSSLERLLDDVGDADMLVTIGGASMGAGDLMKRTLAQRAYRLDFWRVRLRPGSPFSLGWLTVGDREIPVFGLPGNPASAFVTFELFVRPHLRILAGFRSVERPRVRAVASQALVAAQDLAVLLRVSATRTRDGLRVGLTGPQGSGLLSGLPRTDGLALLPAGVGRVEAGAQVEVILLRDPE